MVLGVSISQGIYRCDSTVLPIITATDNNFISRIKIVDTTTMEGWLYLPIFQAPYNKLAFIPPNRTSEKVSVVLRNLFYPLDNWTKSPGVVEVFDGLRIRNTDGTDWKGAYFNTPLSALKCSIEATVTHASTGISLQNSTSPVSHYYFTPDVTHSIIFGEDEQGSIREKGIVPANNGFFKYKLGDKAIIEQIGSIVRYLLVKPNGEIKTLRTTRSKLTSPAKAEVLVFAANSELRDVYIYTDSEVETFFENIGAMHFNKFSNPLHWQRWGDQQSHTSTADVLEMADKTSRYTFPNQKTQLRSIGLRPRSRSRDDFKKFLDFVHHHGNERNFIFVDDARKIDGEKVEYFAKMTGAFVDSTTNGCLFDHTQGIIEDYRNDYIPKVDDNIAPTASLAYVGVGGASPGNLRVAGYATDNIKVVKVQLYKNGFAYGDAVQTDYADAFVIEVPISATQIGNNEFYAIAYDQAGNSAQTNVGYFDNTGGDLIPPTVPSNIVLSQPDGPETQLVQINFDPSTDDSGYWYYQIRANDDYDYNNFVFDWFGDGQDYPPALTNVTVSKPNTIIVEVRAIDGDGNASAWSAPVSYDPVAGLTL